jgi:hypothetical protein
MHLPTFFKLEVIMFAPSTRGRCAGGLRHFCHVIAGLFVLLALFPDLSAHAAPEEPSLVKDIYPGGEGSLPERLAKVNDKLFFTAADDVTGRELWVLTVQNVQPERFYLPLLHR